MTWAVRLSFRVPCTATHFLLACPSFSLHIDTSRLSLDMLFGKTQSHDCSDFSFLLLFGILWHLKVAAWRLRCLHGEPLKHCWIILISSFDFSYNIKLPWNAGENLIKLSRDALDIAGIENIYWIKPPRSSKFSLPAIFIWKSLINLLWCHKQTFQWCSSETPVQKVSDCITATVSLQQKSNKASMKLFETLDRIMICFWYFKLIWL